MVRYFKHIYLLPLLVLTAAWAMPTAPVHLQTAWASLKGGQVELNAVLPVLDSSITVTDDHGASYTITHFRFSYREKSQYQDSSGQVKDNYTLVSKVFYQTNQLDSLWKDNIRTSLHAGDSFTIDNVVVKDAEGKKAMAPTLEIEVIGQ